MSGFSADWLALREGADHRSRHQGLGESLASRLGSKDTLRIIDLGSGTGSNLRATAPLLNQNQEWTLVDYDPALLEAAARVLSDWADTAMPSGNGLQLTKDGKKIAVAFRKADLNRELEDVLSAGPDLVTASALFDLISAEWMVRFAKAIAASGAAFYTVLTYDGRDEFIPEHPFDGAIIRAFAIHQRRDKGFGPAAGPQAAHALVKAFRDVGYGVETGDSPWVLKPSDNSLVQELLAGIAGAVHETKLVPDNSIDDWLAWRQAVADHKGSRLITGHTDILAFPKA